MRRLIILLCVTAGLLMGSTVSVNNSTPPRFRGVGVSSSSIGAISLQPPVQSVPGDLLITIIKTAGEAVATDPDWTAHPDSPVTVGAGCPATTCVSLYWFYRIADGESDDYAAADPGDHWTGRQVSIAGGTFNVASPFGSSTEGSQTSTTAVQLDSYAPDSNNCAIFGASGGGAPDASGTDEFDSPAYGNLRTGDTSAFGGGAVEIGDVRTTQGLGGSLWVWRGVLDIAGGSTGNITATADNAAVRAWTMFCVKPSVTAQTALWRNAPIVRGAGSVFNGTGAISPTPPASAAAGDLLILLIQSSSETALAASGWTEHPGSPVDVDSGACPSTACTTTTVLYRIADGGAEDTAVLNDPGDHTLARMIAIQTGSFNASDPFGPYQASTQAATTAVAVTGTTFGAGTMPLVIAMSTSGLPDAAGAAEFTGGTSNLLYRVEQIDNTTTQGLGGAIWMRTGSIYNPATTTIDTVNATAGTSGVRANLLITVNPVDISQ